MTSAVVYRFGKHGHNLRSVIHFPVVHEFLGLFVFHVEEPLFLVQFADLIHLEWGEFEIENVDVLGDVSMVCCTGNGGMSFLDVPAEDDLRRGLVVGGCYFLDHGMLEQGAVAHCSAKREPGLQYYGVLGESFGPFGPLGIGMPFVGARPMSSRPWTGQRPMLAAVPAFLSG